MATRVDGYAEEVLSGQTSCNLNIPPEQCFFSTMLHTGPITKHNHTTETSLYYYRARYYDSTSGRFLREDPVRFAGGRNFYSYVTNNPVKRTDPLGSRHCTNQATDIAPTGMDQKKVFCAASNYGANYIKNENDHWHIQTTPGKKGSSGLLPKPCDCK